MSEDKRRDARYRAHVPIRMTRGKETTSLLSDDVSFRGAFLRMDVPLQLRQLVKVEVSLPSGATITSHAMVVYRVAPGGEHPPGVGIQFYGLEGRERAHWEQFVHRVREEAPRSSPNAVVAAPPSAPDPVRRKHERHSLRFEVHLTTVDELVRLYTRDISKGGMAVETDMELEVGTAVGLDLVHPDNNSVFELEAVVRRKIRQGAARGLGVEFLDMDEERREELAAFIGPSLPKEPVETVKEGDPRLL
jgi:uncharacterized protein (TIGR02266 family)